METSQDLGVERRNNVNFKLQTMLESLRKEKPYRKDLEIVKGSDDVCTLNLKGKMEKIRQVKEEIDSYQNEGQHFTRQYRTLEGHCGKLQTELDRIDVFGRNDLKEMRKAALLDVDSLIKTLTKKAHSSGIVCKNCEVQN